MARTPTQHSLLSTFGLKAANGSPASARRVSWLDEVAAELPLQLAVLRTMAARTMLYESAAACTPPASSGGLHGAGWG